MEDQSWETSSNSEGLVVFFTIYLQFQTPRKFLMILAPHHIQSESSHCDAELLNPHPKVLQLFTQDFQLENSHKIQIMRLKFLHFLNSSL